MSRLIARGLLLGVAALTGCARMAPPPGGPIESTPPRLLGSRDSVATIPGFDGWVEFRFDEVISEGGSPNYGYGNGDLERLIILSPDTLVPTVRWGRTMIRVRPRGGWRPDQLYRIELLPGVRDLRNNTSKETAVVTVVTGGAAPTRYVSGRAVDWVSRSAVPGALIEVITLPDSQTYRGSADSTGRFEFGPLRNTEMIVRVVIDRNGDRRISSGEAWEQARLVVDQDAVGELWAYMRDTTPVKSTGVVTVRDTVAFNIPVTHPLAPDLLLSPDSIRIITLPDSTPVRAMAARPLALWDSVRRARREAEGVAPPVVTPPPPPPPGSDTLPGPDIPRANKQVIGTTLVVELQSAPAPGTRFRIEVFGVRTLSGTSGTIRADIQTPEPPKPPPADSVVRDTLPRSGRP